MAMTAGRAARRYGISRTALLYYDELGLVKPSERSAAGYRLYGDADLEKLKTVIGYREAGIGLTDIASLLTGRGSLEAALLRRLDALNGEIIAAKKKQAAVIALIQSLCGNTDDGKWVQALREAGLTGGDAKRLHDELEEHSPKLHAEFLRALGFNENDIAAIRRRHGKAEKSTKP